MKNKKLFVGVILLIAVLMLGIGYAAISKQLFIEGTVTAKPDDSNFTVIFLSDDANEPTTTKVNGATGATVSATIENTTNADLTVTGLTAKGDKVSATYTVQNTSADLSAQLDVVPTVTGTNASDFEVTATTAKTTIAKNETTTVTVTVELLKTPTDGELTANVKATLTATAVQP